MGRADSLAKILMLGKTEGRRRGGTKEDEMAEWHHQLNEHELEQTLGLECCSPLGLRVGND